MNVRKTDKGQWLYDFRYKGKRYRVATQLSKALTREAGDRHLLRLRAERAGVGDCLKAGTDGNASAGKVLFEDFAESFMDLYSKVNKRSWRRDEVSLASLKPFFKNRYLQQIGPELVERYKAQRLEVVSPATTNRELALLKTIFSKAVEWGKIEINPIAKVKKFREENVKERILTPGEAGRLIEASKGRLRPILTIALNTGMRRNEILSLRWQDVNFASNYIQIEPAKAKSGKGRKVPMNALVLAALRALPKRHALVFFNPKTGSSIKEIKASFKTACRKAGIKGLRLHDLRHTAATRMIEGGADIATVSKILGHASIQMTMRYCHPMPENMQRAVDRLGDSFKNAFQLGRDADKKPEKKFFNIPVRHILVYS